MTVQVEASTLMDEGQTFPVRVVARLTGLSPELLRAWERRYEAVVPLRTEGGTRRYTAADLERLRLLREVVDAGHRIGDVAGLGLDRLRALLDGAGEQSLCPVVAWSERVLLALDRLDGEAVQRLLTERMSAVGPAEFGRAYVLPLEHEIGARWEGGDLSIAAEHLATTLIRSLLISALESLGKRQSGPKIVFATPSGEQHDLGMLVVALTAGEAGAQPIFIGADVPEDDLVASVQRTRAAVLALGIVTLPAEQATPILKRLRRRLSPITQIWIGGAGANACPPIRGVDRIGNLDQLAAHVALHELAADSSGAHE